MASDLIFKRSPGPATSPVTFVFGSGEVSALAADLEVSLPGPQINWHLAPPHDSAADFTLPGPQVVIQAVKAHNSNLLAILGLPQVEIDSQVFTQVKVDADLNVTLPGPQVVFYAVKPHDGTADFSIPGPEVVWVGQYDSQTSRPTVGQFTTSFQDAQDFEGGVDHGYNIGSPFETGPEALHQVALRLGGLGGDGWQKGSPVRTKIDGTFQDADRLRGDLNGLFQQGVLFRVPKDTTFQRALSLAAINCTAFHQVMLRHARPNYTSPWQVSRLMHKVWATQETNTLPLDFSDLMSPFQQAMKPRQGVSFEPLPVPPPHLCYTPPVGRVDFTFKRSPSSSPTLVFRCDDKPITPWVIPTRQVYVVQNHVFLNRSSDDAPIQVFAATVSTDRTSWTWGLDAQISIFDLPKVEPTGSGPVEVDLSINGFLWKFLIEDYRDNRIFGSNTVSISGRSKTAILDEPYARKTSVVQTSPVMSKALAESVLTYNGVSLGFDLDWSLVDVLGWQVPENTWSYQSLPPIQALKAIAESVGGYVMSHPSQDTLLVRSGYPAKSWSWDTETPDVSLPMDIVLSRSLSWSEKPAYNAISLSGEKTGFKSLVKRAGTAGDDEAPPYSHALLCSESALSEYAKCVLSSGGKQARMGLTLPLSAETGLLSPGKLVAVTGDESWRALTRGISVSVAVSENELEVLQTLELERHYWD